MLSAGIQGLLEGFDRKGFLTNNTVINGMDVSDTEELAADMMSLLASFSGKFYGKRSAERRKKKNEEQRRI